MIARPWYRLLPWMFAFALAMAFLESAVVIYLRELYYPTGFRFPVAPITPRIAITELVRELATLIMLLAPGALLSTRRIDRFAWFCFCFGVWDIFYYVFLKVVLDWPATLFDMDILFLVPVVWVGPVLAPCITSLGLIALAAVILHRRHLDPLFSPARWHWAVLVLSGSIVLFTFIEEPCKHILRTHGVADTSALPAAGHMALDRLREYVPAHYSWSVFGVACVLTIAVIINMARRKRTQGVATENSAVLLTK